MERMEGKKERGKRGLGTGGGYSLLFLSVHFHIFDVLRSNYFL